MHVASLIFSNIGFLALLQIIVLIINFYCNINNISNPDNSYKVILKSENYISLLSN